MKGRFQMKGGKNWFLSERDECKPVLLGLSLAGNLVKPLLSLYGTKWRERGYGLRCFKRFQRLVVAGVPDVVGSLPCCQHPSVAGVPAFAVVPVLALVFKKSNILDYQTIGLVIFSSIGLSIIRPLNWGNYWLPNYWSIDLLGYFTSYELHVYTSVPTYPVQVNWII